jgi:RNA polymerase sigma-70 factor (ECF subfamily)
MYSSDETATELEWLAALRQGDEAALRRLFDRYYPLLVGELLRLVPDVDTAKDLVQEVFVELWRRREQLDVHTSVRAYLRRAAVNRALNYLKSSRRLRFESEAGLPDLPAAPSVDEQQHEETRETLESALHRAIEALPERCRIVFSLSRFGELSHREIAEQLDISVKTIENQITKAMKLLREALLRHSDLSSIVILAVNWLWWT